MYFDKNSFLSSQDFATPSLSEENAAFLTDDDAERREIKQFQLRKSWESRWETFDFFSTQMLHC